ncbi:PREDICTED: uncharacterized protein LOC104699784 [Camelina sativa]|uniref:Uncharacterized protein LOC104699784 n=1 Tax=Camelina sativa TaxID=90675 RepID=A0ABM0SML5_CAMSA|nr:PREDICTED: uncharacterized protein LOC104699784 [Camelina sativa]
MKVIVSQSKLSGEQPIWINPTLWKQMWEHWDTPEAIEKSSNASQARNSNRGGLGLHKHLSGQKSYLQIQQKLEEKLGHPVSLGEVFVATHTKADGSFVDQKAKQVAETYEKNIEEVMSQMEFDGPDATDHSPESTHPTLPIQEKDDIFLKCTVTDAKGTPFGLGSLSEIITKGKRKANYPSSSPTSLLEIEEQLQAARCKFADQDEENARRVREDARRDEEQRNAQNRIATLEMLVSYLKTSDPGVAEFMSTQPPAHAPFTTAAPAANITPATTANVNPPAPTTSGASSPATSPNTSPLSVSSSHP